MGPVVPCIAVSTAYVLLTCFLAEALRKLVSAYVPNGLAKSAVLEAIAGAELCGAGFELIISKYISRDKSIEVSCKSKFSKLPLHDVLERAIK